MNPEVLPAPGLSDSHELKEDLPMPSLPGTLSLRGFRCGSDLGVFNHGNPRPQSVKMKNDSTIQRGKPFCKKCLSVHFLPLHYLRNPQLMVALR